MLHSPERETHNVEIKDDVISLEDLASYSILGKLPGFPCKLNYLISQTTLLPNVLSTTYYLLPATYYLLLYLLPTTYYLLPTTYYLLPTTYYLLYLLMSPLPAAADSLADEVAAAAFAAGMMD